MSTTITLTDEQEQSIVAKRVASLTTQLTKNTAEHAKQIASVQRRATNRVDRAKQKTAEWRLRYNELRKRYLEAQADNVTLRRRIRNGEWEDT